MGSKDRAAIGDVIISTQEIYPKVIEKLGWVHHAWLGDAICVCDESHGQGSRPSSMELQPRAQKMHG